MLLDLTREFQTWLTRLTGRANDGDAAAQQRLELVTAQLTKLRDLGEQPRSDSMMLKPVRQSRTHAVWRVSHRYIDGIAMRLIVWFPPDRPDTVVVVLFAGDKANMGDVFYNSVGTRADAAINTYMLEEGAHDV